MSLTSVPRRLDTSLRDVLQALSGQRDCPPVILNIPHTYRKWGPCHLPSYLQDIPGLIVNRTEDFGPATKLLGALLHLKDHGPVSHVITVDDDVVFSGRTYLRYLMRCARIVPDAALTVGGIELVEPPYRCGAGLRYHGRDRFVDAPAGFRGVVYPAAPLLASSLTFSLHERLPAGVFHEDDAFFGILLNRLGIRLLALPPPLSGPLRFSEGAGESAVAEQTGTDRMTNESDIYLDAVERGLLVPASTRMDAPLGLGQRLRLRGEQIRAAWRA